MSMGVANKLIVYACAMSVTHCNSQIVMVLFIHENYSLFMLLLHMNDANKVSEIFHIVIFMSVILLGM